jgi:amidase
MVPLAIGNDALGSVRVPAASCGVVGVKPGSGVLPSEIGVNSWYGTAVNGPFATTVDDVRRALVVLSGGAVGNTDPGVDQVRIGVLDSSLFPGTRVTDEARAGMRTVAEALTRAGLTVRPVGSLSLQRFGVPIFARWFATAHAEAERLDRSQLQPRTRRSASLGGWVRAWVWSGTRTRPPCAASWLGCSPTTTSC